MFFMENKFNRCRLALILTLGKITIMGFLSQNDTVFYFGK